MKCLISLCPIACAVSIWAVLTLVARALSPKSFFQLVRVPMRAVHRCLLMAVSCACPSLPAWAADYYRITDLGVLPGFDSRSEAHAINENGQVVGESFSPFPFFEPRAFLWSRDAGMRDLGDLPGGGDHSSAYGINESGQVVGGSYATTGPRAFLWTSAGGMQDLGDLPGGQDESTAQAINNLGQIVGSSRVPTGYRGFVWTASGGMEDLGQLPGRDDYSIAQDINDNGEIAGSSTVPGQAVHAVVWTSQRQLLDLGDLAGGQEISGAVAINNNGSVAGVGTTASGPRAFLWTSSGGMRSLGALMDNGAVGARSEAEDINDTGQVVGWSLVGGQSRAIVWKSGSGLQNLNSLLDSSGNGWMLISARGINNSGQIVGIGTNPQGSERAFLLTPVSPPPLTAFTEFNDPAVGASTFAPGPADEELGFMTTSSPSGRVNPLVGVSVVGEGGGTRAFAHRSVNATTTYDVVDLTNYDDVSISLRMQVANTTYEVGDFARAYVTNGVDSIDVVNAIGTAATDALDEVAGGGFLEYRARIPDGWSQAALVISSSSNSTQGAERFDFDSIEIRGIPEPSTWGLAVTAVAAVCWRCFRRGRRRLKSPAEAGLGSINRLLLNTTD